ncbi:MAG: hypothetical protein ACRENH_03410 [Gemmatimonadaceae bacterium]
MTGPRLTRAVVATLASAVALFVLARTSALPLGYHNEDAAGLRLSWSARPERIEVCRTLSAEEIARRGEHMRQRFECEGRFAAYDLRVEIDDRVLDETIVRGSGWRHDRPLYVLRDFTIAGGLHRVRVFFSRREQSAGDSLSLAQGPALGPDTGIFAGHAERERIERMRRARAAIPARLVLDTALALTTGRVTVVTFDVDRKSLAVITGADSPR